MCFMVGLLFHTKRSKCRSPCTDTCRCTTAIEIINQYYELRTEPVHTEEHTVKVFNFAGLFSQSFNFVNQKCLFIKILGLSVFVCDFLCARIWPPRKNSQNEILNQKDVVSL